MRILIIIFLLVSTNLFGQTMSEKEIEKYTLTVDSLKKEHILKKFFYPNMSGCGGAVYGYYKHDKLLLIESSYQAELGYSRKIIYFKDTIVCKIIYREHFAEWGKYEKKYPHDIYAFDASKMTYTDTLYTILLGKKINFIKSSDNVTISNIVDMDLINKLIICGREMKYELKTEKTSR